jgi:hypothetical protein
MVSPAPFPHDPQFHRASVPRSELTLLRPCADEGQPNYEILSSRGSSHLQQDIVMTYPADRLTENLE